MSSSLVEFVCSNSVSAATGLAPNDVQMGRLTRLHLTILKRAGVAGHQCLACDHLVYRDLAIDRQQRSYHIVHEPLQNPPFPLAPLPQLTPRTVPFSAISSCIWMCLPTCPARMPTGAFRFNAASPVPTLTTVATYHSICRRSCGIRVEQLRHETFPVLRNSRRRFDSSSPTRSGEDHRTPIGSTLRWCN